MSNDLLAIASRAPSQKEERGGDAQDQTCDASQDHASSGLNDLVYKLAEGVPFRPSSLWVGGIMLPAEESAAHDSNDGASKRDEASDDAFRHANSLIR